jgi:hypothetical protein
MGELMWVKGWVDLGDICAGNGQKKSTFVWRGQVDDIAVTIQK